MTTTEIEHPREWQCELRKHPRLSKGNICLGLRGAINEVFLGIAPWPLVITGEAGAGKTCAALLMLERFGLGFFFRLRDWCTRVSDAQFGRLLGGVGESGARYPLTEKDVWDGWQAPMLAVLDDIGAREKVSDHHYDCLYLALDKRMGKPTVYTTNLTIKAIAKCYDDRIASRLRAGTVVHIVGDKRQAMGKRITAALL